MHLELFPAFTAFISISPAPKIMASDGSLDQCLDHWKGIASTETKMAQGHLSRHEPHGDPDTPRKTSIELGMVEWLMMNSYIGPGLKAAQKNKTNIITTLTPLK